MTQTPTVAERVLDALGDAINDRGGELLAPFVEGLTDQLEATDALLRRVPDAEDVLILNNGAAALLLACVVLGPELVVSRGELVEIGDGFRLPDLITSGGVHLREVGEARSCGEIEGHFKRNFDMCGVTTACEYLADQGLLGKAATPVRLTKKSNVTVQELAFFYRGEPRDGC